MLKKSLYLSHPKNIKLSNAYEKVVIIDVYVPARL